MPITRRTLMAEFAAIALPLPACAQVPLARETRVYKTVGTLEIKADIYHGVGSQPCPAILYIHGGALFMESRRSMPPRWELERFTAAGFTVVTIDYRLAPATKLPEILEDVTAAYAWAISESSALSIDPERIQAS